MKYLIPLMLLLLSCADEGVGRTRYRVVENPQPELRFEEAPADAWASTEEIQALINEKKAAELAAEAERAEAAKAADLEATVASEIETPDFRVATALDEVTSDEPIDVRQLSSEAREERVAAFRAALGSRLKSPPPERIRDRGADDLRKKAAKEEPAKAAQPSKQERSRSGGGQLFKVADRGPRIGSVLPPGRFFSARLLGNLNVTALGTPVFAEILDRENAVIGIAVGTAQLHRTLKNRAVLSFNTLHLTEGDTINGSMDAFELDLSQGLIGRAERHSLRRIVNSVVETVLAALSLEVDTGSDFGSVFKIQMADRLLKQAQERVNDIDLERMVVIQRDRLFRIASTQSLSTAPGKPVNEKLRAFSQEAFQSTLNSQDYATGRKQELRNAYQRLSDRLKDLN